MRLERRLSSPRNHSYAIALPARGARKPQRQHQAPFLSHVERVRGAEHREAEWGPIDTGDMKLGPPAQRSRCSIRRAGFLLAKRGRRRPAFPASAFRGFVGRSRSRQNPRPTIRSTRARWRCGLQPSATCSTICRATPRVSPDGRRAERPGWSGEPGRCAPATRPGITRQGEAYGIATWSTKSSRPPTASPSGRWKQTPIRRDRRRHFGKTGIDLAGPRKKDFARRERQTRVTIPKKKRPAMRAVSFASRSRGGKKPPCPCCQAWLRR